MIEFDPERGFGVYLHWPYCARICPYCDFNVYAAKARDTAPLFEAMLKDLEGWRARTGARKVDSVYFGGGTPSLMTQQQVEAAVSRIDALWGLKAGAEVTLEANPDDAGRLAALAAAGANRLSLGVQALDDRALAFLGRTHSSADAIGAFERARGHFSSVSIDLIYARPGQDAADWRSELSRALALQPDHLSLYELSIEPGSAFAQAVARKRWSPMEDDVAADFYEMTQEMTEAAGYCAYEISNHAREAQGQSRHNRIYWSSGDWVGVGPGAHGRLTGGGERWATEAAEKPGAYLHQVNAHGVGWAAAESLGRLAQARERIAMGLRVAEGFCMSDVEQLGLSLDMERVKEFEALGLLTRLNGRIALAPRGRLTADRISAAISP